MGLLSVIGMAHGWVRQRVQPGDAVIDATLGGGVDARFLAELVGPRGSLIGFDVQEEALRRTRERLEPLQAAGRLPAATSLLLQSHGELETAVPPELRGRIAAVLFNLGYLPGSEDTSLITTPQTTLPALEAALRVLRPGGILACVLYPGHPGGAEEADEVMRWAAGLPAESAQAAVYRLVQKPSAPYALGIEKKASPTGSSEPSSFH
ncbi:SAM-dependent methyltransferase, MraW methylase family [Paenibacillus pasadenensis]|uniref:SAM-dependent methyltransferase, MraW methylase family n=1 Tax=Paenibacillus pasadenensis TaxID=217090 RepID=A0A2N5N3T2_9BACL|nr:MULTISPECIES: class I SAM-dependent methyltransferase [Paenibacillus]PLT45005.1 SAM-dependent methyltransferase, MraW methylase family [Paenibacillus pasadenensis]QGG55430.1 16S rRNA (cytosine(1402)-N(4))-methyltransferase [Paenibacillus sp. B01]